MRSHSGSLLRKLELSFALAAFLLAGLLALFMDHALRRSLEAEDGLVMEAQARALGAQVQQGGFPGEHLTFPEKSEWRVLGKSPL